jgi:hypothetical protein
VKKIILSLFAALVLNISYAGIIFDDPVQLRAETIHHWFSSDEINFSLAEKSKSYLFFNVDFKITLKYSDATRTISFHRDTWGFETPLIVSIDTLSDLESFTITGAFESQWEPNGYKPQNNGDRQHDNEELMKALKRVTGYKIDSTFNMQK